MHMTTPSLEAESTIRPFRGVALGSAENQAVEANANNMCIGVSDGSTRSFDSANHAEDGDAIRLQPGAIVRIECGGTVTVAANVKTDADGKGVAAAGTGATNQYVLGPALENGASGTIIQVVWQPFVIRPALS